MSRSQGNIAGARNGPAALASPPLSVPPLLAMLHPQVNSSPLPHTQALPGHTLSSPPLSPQSPHTPRQLCAVLGPPHAARDPRAVAHPPAAPHHRHALALVHPLHPPHGARALACLREGDGGVLCGVARGGKGGWVAVTRPHPHLAKTKLPPAFTLPPPPLPQPPPTQPPYPTPVTGRRPAGQPAVRHCGHRGAPAARRHVPGLCAARG